LSFTVLLYQRLLPPRHTHNHISSRVMTV